MRNKELLSEYWASTIWLIPKTLPRHFFPLLNQRCQKDWSTGTHSWHSNTVAFKDNISVCPASELAVWTVLLLILGLNWFKTLTKSFHPSISQLCLSESSTSWQLSSEGHKSKDRVALLSALRSSGKEPWADGKPHVCGVSWPCVQRERLPGHHSGRAQLLVVVACSPVPGVCLPLQLCWAISLPGAHPIPASCGFPVLVSGQGSGRCYAVTPSKTKYLFTVASP